MRLKTSNTPDGRCCDMDIIQSYTVNYPIWISDSEYKQALPARVTLSPLYAQKKYAST